MNKAHSQIDSYPIDENRFPLAKNVPFIEFEMVENDYLFIPSSWYHWIFTSPETIALTYEFDPSNDMSFLKESSIPFVEKGATPIMMKYNDLFLYNPDINVNIMYSSTFDITPINKTNLPIDSSKYYETDTLLNAYTSIKPGFPYKYIQYQYIISSINKLPIDLSSVIGKQINNKSIPKLWVSFDQFLQTGLHNDIMHGIIHVISGSKTVFLAPPSEKTNLYITPMPGIYRTIINPSTVPIINQTNICLNPFSS